MGWHPVGGLPPGNAMGRASARSAAQRRTTSSGRRERAIRARPHIRPAPHTDTDSPRRIRRTSREGNRGGEPRDACGTQRDRSRAPRPLAQRLERDRFPPPASNSRQVVRGNPPHPRPERALATERSEVREDDDQDLLCGVLSVGGLTQHAKGEPVDVVLNRLEDRVCRDSVPCRRGSRVRRGRWCVRGSSLN